jgi:hypothetical protein
VTGLVRKTNKAARTTGPATASAPKRDDKRKASESLDGNSAAEQTDGVEAEYKPTASSATTGAARGGTSVGKGKGKDDKQAGRKKDKKTGPPANPETAEGLTPKRRDERKASCSAAGTSDRHAATASRKKHKVSKGPASSSDEFESTEDSDESECTEDQDFISNSRHRVVDRKERRVVDKKEKRIAAIRSKSKAPRNNPPSTGELDGLDGLAKIAVAEHMSRSSAGRSASMEQGRLAVTAAPGAREDDTSETNWKRK